LAYLSIDARMLRPQTDAAIAREWILPLLAAAAFLLLPFGRAIELPLAVLALFGLHALLASPSWMARAPVGVLLLCFAAYHLPMWLSLPDAVNPARSLRTTLGSLRFLLAGLGVLYLLYGLNREPRPERALRRLEHALLVLLLLWVGDALLQAGSGRNLLGYAAERGYINGLFGAADNLKLSLALCVLAPPVLLGAPGRRWRWASTLLFALTVLVIVLTGKRSAWFCAFVLCGLATLCHHRSLLRHWRAAAVALALPVLLVLPLAGNSEWASARGQAVLEALRAPDYQHLNAATGLRLPIWEGAARVIAQHPLNGVGVRGFRYAYAEVAKPGDPFALPTPDGGSRAAHAHLLTLEVLTDTGLFGLLGYVLMLLSAALAWLRCAPEGRARSLPWLLGALALAHPLATQGAWYSSWTASLFWLMLTLALAAMRCSPRWT
jgi:O-antigen ligase